MIADRDVRWKRAREIFDDVADLGAADRTGRLAYACGDDLELRREVESLLSHDRSSNHTIEKLVADAALDVDPGSATDSTTPMPSVIGRYRVLTKLGEGGMAEVFLAEDASLDRRVALKVPSARLAGDPQVRLQLQQEARVAATINHPHVCVVHEVGEGPIGRPFIAMEYVEGETLSDRIRRGRLPADEVMELGRQAASALGEAHSKGVVHRDLKPSNIMLTPHGVKLLDFGLASVTRDPSLARKGTAAHLLAGTIPYMSPEQVRLEDVDHRTDLYSLGVVLYEAATGKRPFEAPTPRATCEAILKSNPPPATAIVDGLPEQLDRVMSRALAKDRAQRNNDSPHGKGEQTMRMLTRSLLAGLIAAAVATPVIGQVHKYFSPGTVWSVTMIRIAPGMDQMYMQYLDGQFKKSEDAQVKAGFEKLYKILRTMDDGGEWNLLIMREFASLAALEANEDKADALAQQTEGADQVQMQGYQDRSKYREVVATKFTREVVLK